MAYSSSGKTHVEESVNLDSVVIYLKKILQHWKIVVISAVVLAVLGFAVAKLTYTPSYSSKITFIANNKSSAAPEYPPTDEPTLPEIIPVCNFSDFLRQ